jgi:hypothetical protein
MTPSQGPARSEPSEVDEAHDARESLAVDPAPRLLDERLNPRGGESEATRGEESKGEGRGMTVAGERAVDRSRRACV